MTDPRTKPLRRNLRFWLCSQFGLCLHDGSHSLIKSSLLTERGSQRTSLSDTQINQVLLDLRVFSFDFKDQKKKIIQTVFTKLLHGLFSCTCFAANLIYCVHVPDVSLLLHQFVHTYQQQCQILLHLAYFPLYFEQMVQTHCVL